MEISVDQMYKIENAGHAMGFLKKFMMENAGAAAARRLDQSMPVKSKKIFILAGLGNNGGDGLVMARHLAGRGATVAVELLGEPDKIRTEECAWNWSLIQKMPSIIRRAPEWEPDIVVDAILGTGITGAAREPYASAIRRINGYGCYKMALDVPSGMNPQTGESAEPCARVDVTVTFHKIKAGIPKRPELTGTVHTEKIGIPPEAEAGIV